jgi:hypothetical protein
VVGQGVVELNYAAAGEAFQVMVLGGSLDLVVVVALVKVKLVHQPLLLKLEQVAVDGGEAQAGLFAAGAAVDFVGVQVALFSTLAFFRRIGLLLLCSGVIANSFQLV